MIRVKKVSNGFKIFMEESNGVGPAFMEAVMKNADNSSIPPKYRELAYIAVLVTAKMYGGLAYHTAQARELGATEDEIKSAVLLTLPITGIAVSDALACIYGEK